VAEKNLDYYLQNPDELPSDPEVIEGLIAQQGGATETEQPEPEPTKEAEAPEPTTPPEQQEPDVVLTKDGKRGIPYKVLASERERARVAEQAVETLTAQLEALKNSAPGEAPKPEAENALTDEDLAALGEDFPMLKKVIDGLTGQIQGLQETVTTLRDREVSRIEVEAKSAGDSVQAAIDATPELLYWQQENPEMFERAVKFDDALLSDPNLKALPIGDRFARVVAIMEATYGKTELPPEYQKAPPAAELGSLAAKAIAKATQKVPRTLSDLPGGIPPAQSEQEQVESMSPRALEARMMKMSPDDLSAFLAKVI
jgi:hypothetical protein